MNFAIGDRVRIVNMSLGGEAFIEGEAVLLNSADPDRKPMPLWKVRFDNGDEFDRFIYTEEQIKEHFNL